MTNEYKNTSGFLNKAKLVLSDIKVLFKIMFVILRKPYLVYNIYVVGEKPGKPLNKLEKFINFTTNLIAAYLTIFITLSIPTVIIIGIINQF